MASPSPTIEGMGVHHPTDVSWSDLPAPVAESILREAFHAGNRSLLQRLNMSLVCKEWRVVMSRQAVDVVLTLPPKVSKVAEAVAKQSAWLRATSVPLRSIVIKPASHDRGNHYQKLAKRAATKLTVSTYMLAASQHTLEEAYGLSVPKAPRHVTTLAWFSQLRCLSLSGMEGLQPAKVQELLTSLPTSLETLQLRSLAKFEGRSFACLPRLRKLDVEAQVPPMDDSHSYNEIIPVRFAGLPAGLQTLKVSVPAMCDTLDVTWAPGPPSALLRLDAIVVKLKCVEDFGNSTGASGVEVLELITADLILRTHGAAPAGTTEEYDSADPAELQPCFGRYLADWIAQCGVDTVRLGFLNEPATEGFCYISSKTPTDHPYVWEVRQAAFKAGSMELLDAVKGPCKERGIRCTDVNGDGQLLLFQRSVTWLS